MRTILDWKCGYCNSVQKSDSSKRWSMDYCHCGQSFVDLEDHYQRNMGEIIVLNTATFGEIDQDLYKNKPNSTNKVLHSIREMAKILDKEKLKHVYSKNKKIGKKINSKRKSILKKIIFYTLIYLLGIVSTCLYMYWWLNGL
tara:strand:+ start:266 stop:691 length:426 start_codon:yes stop_codon:yes gene_type:complete